MDIVKLFSDNIDNWLIVDNEIGVILKNGTVTKEKYIEVAKKVYGYCSNVSKNYCHGLFEKYSDELHEIKDGVIAKTKTGTQGICHKYCKLASLCHSCNDAESVVCMVNMVNYIRTIEEIEIFDEQKALNYLKEYFLMAMKWYNDKTTSLREVVVQTKGDIELSVPVNLTEEKVALICERNEQLDATLKQIEDGEFVTIESCICDLKVEDFINNKEVPNDKN